MIAQRILRTLFLVTLVTVSCTREEEPIPGSSAPMQVPVPEDAGVEPGVALVCFSEDMTALLEEDLSLGNLQTKSAQVNELVEELGIEKMERLFPFAGEYERRTRRAGLHRWYIVDFSREMPVTRAADAMARVPGVEAVEPNRLVRRQEFNDPRWGNMWGLHNTRYSGYDVDCLPVWESYTTGNPKVIVGVVDGGIQLTHPDLKDNIAASGHRNYVSGGTTITQHEHGTHVAGTIGAVNNNGEGVCGIAGGDAAHGQKGIKLLSLQVFETRDGYEYSARNFATAIKEAADKGAVICQNSWGYTFDFDENGRVEGYELDYARSAHENPERSFTQAVDYFNTYAGCDNDGNQLKDSPMKGGVVIFAAGNDNLPYGAPGNYDGCISVGAISRTGSRASFSNYGNWLDICAPGVDIVSTNINGRYATFSGTSMACPHVSGVAALIASYFGGAGFTADELRNRLLNGARPIGPSTGTYAIGPLVDAYGSFIMQGSGKAPDKIATYSVETVGHTLHFEFTANDAYGYIVLAGRTENAVRNANLVQPGSNLVWTKRIVASADAAGKPVSIQLRSLEPNTHYYVAVAGYSYSQRYSELSAVKYVSTDANGKPVITIPEQYADGNWEFRHWQTADIPVGIHDPDGDEFTTDFQTDGRATFTSTDGSVSNMHFRLMCPLVSAPATFEAALVVEDEMGERVVKNIRYKVLANVPPVQKRSFDPVLLHAAGEQVSFPLDEYFADEDGEALDYRAVSSDQQVVSVKVEEKQLLLTVHGKGAATVTVSASDAEGAVVTAQISVLVREEGETISIEEDLTDIRGSLTILPGLQEALTSVRILSVTGAVVYQTEGMHSAVNPVRLDMSALAPGLYYVEVTYEGETTRFTLVKR